MNHFLPALSSSCHYLKIGTPIPSSCSTSKINLALPSIYFPVLPDIPTSAAPELVYTQISSANYSNHAARTKGRVWKTVRGRTPPSSCGWSLALCRVCVCLCTHMYLGRIQGRGLEGGRVKWKKESGWRENTACCSLTQGSLCGTYVPVLMW